MRYDAGATPRHGHNLPHVMNPCANVTMCTSACVDTPRRMATVQEGGPQTSRWKNQPLIKFPVTRRLTPLSLYVPSAHSKHAHLASRLFAWLSSRKSRYRISTKRRAKRLPRVVEECLPDAWTTRELIDIRERDICRSNSRLEFGRKFL